MIQGRVESTGFRATNLAEKASDLWSHTADTASRRFSPAVEIQKSHHARWGGMLQSQLDLGINIVFMVGSCVSVRTWLKVPFWLFV